MPKAKRIRHEKPYYLIPIAMGMAGVLFSNQLEDKVLQAIVILICLAVPLFVGGNVLGRIHSGGTQRFLLIAGMISLTLGAIASMTGFSQSLVDYDWVSQEVGAFSRNLGIASLLLGLLVVIYTIVRSEAIIDALGERFSYVADHMSEGFALVDNEGVILRINQSLVRITDFSEDLIVGRKAWDLVKEFGVEANAKTDRAHTHDGVLEYEFSWEQDARTIHCHATATPIFSNKREREGTLLIIRDVTREHVLAESLAKYNEGLEVLVDEQTRKLRASEKRFRELLLTMDEGFMTVDEQARIRFSNDRIAEVLRVSKDLIINRDLFDFIQLDDRPRLRNTLASVREGASHQYDQEYTMVRDDGGYVPVKVSIAAVGGENDEEPQFSLVITDVHELKEMHRQLEFRAAELERVNEELRELDKAKDTFLSNVSHELRTPLGTLDGYMDMLMSGTLGELEGPQTGAVKVMQRNVERLTSMINEMIEFSRMEIRGIKLFYTVFDVNKLVKECVASAHPAAFQKDIEINVHVESRRRYMWGDRAKLVQVLGILLSNAVKFTHEEGEVEVTLQVNDDGEITIVVADTGIGIEADFQERIFQKFYQVDSSMTRQFEGTGIGLSIANNIATAHGGKIELESKLKEGSRFTVHLPEALLDVDSSSLEQYQLEGVHVFIVNQLEDFRSACAHMFNKMGCIVTEFESAYDAIRAAHTQEPGLFLIGETLPDVSGIVAVSLIKEDLSISDVPVILMKSRTKHDQDVNVEDAIELEKPFAVSTFIQAVRLAQVAPEVEAGQGG